MKKFLNVPMSLIVLCSAVLLSGCGGAGMDGWKTMHVDGASVSFEMPEPIKQQMDEANGVIQFISQKIEQKLEFRVTIQKRDLEKDKSNGVTDETALTNFTQRILQGNQQQFQKMGMRTEFQFNGKFPVEGGLGTQYQAHVGKAFVLERFYQKDAFLYWVELTTQDPNNADANRFLNSFKP